jgi:hypothetical protein
MIPGLYMVTLNQVEKIVKPASLFKSYVSYLKREGT